MPQGLPITASESKSLGEWTDAAYNNGIVWIAIYVFSHTNAAILKQSIEI
jgi:hypothetical protein